MILSRALASSVRNKCGRCLEKNRVRQLRGIAIATLPFFLLLPVLFSATALAREDSVNLRFQKTAGIRQTQPYVVKKGDSLISIFRRQRGDEPVPYALIRQLNPRIKDLNRIYPGQNILLPERETLEPSEPPAPTDKEMESQSRTYAVREGDSISRIILEELNASLEEVLPVYRLLRQLNPGITDLNHLTAGQLLTLPQKAVPPISPPAVPPVSPAAGPVQTALRQEEKALEQPSPKNPPATDRLLGYIGPVITRMKGTITTAGNYFIPLKDTAQVTLDCFLIPVVELDDGSTILLDFSDRLSDGLKDLIRQSWPNYAFLGADHLRDRLASLQGIISHSQNYTMTAVDKPLILTKTPDIMAFPDWIVAGKKAAGGILYRQGLFFLSKDERPLPPEARLVLEKNGLVVTEIFEGQAVATTDPAIVATVPDLRRLKGITFAEELFKAIGEKPSRRVDVVIFDHARDGFNLTILADLLLQKGDTRFIIQTKKLPEQFIRMLRREGTEVLLIAENASGRSAVENLLQSLKIPVSFGHFSFRIPQDSARPRLTTTFSALRVMIENEPFYLIDFDASPEALSLLQGRQGVRIGKY